MIPCLTLVESYVQELYQFECSPSSVNVSLMQEPGLTSMVCIPLGPFMSLENDCLACICSTKGSNKGPQQGFLKDT